MSVRKILFWTVALGLGLAWSNPAAAQWRQDPVLGFRMNVPAGWQVNFQSDGPDRIMNCLSPDQNLSITVRAFPVTPGLTLEAVQAVVETRLLAGFQRTGQAAYTLNGLSGQVVYYQGLYNNYIPVGVAAFYGFHQGLGYIVSSMTPISMWAVRSAEADAILHTFTPGRGPEQTTAQAPRKPSTPFLKPRKPAAPPAPDKPAPKEPAQPEEAAVDTDVNIPSGQPAGKYDLAVIIGNRNYTREGVPPVEYALRDLEMMKKYLVTTMGFDPENIIEEKDATKATMEILFGTRDNPQGRLARWVRKGVSRVFVYYVGHGAPEPKSGEGYFLPVDGDPDYIASVGYPIALFYENLKKVPAKEMVVVLDACFSGRTPKGLLFKKVSPAALRVQEAPAEVANGAVLSSSQGNQMSTWYEKKKHSLFTYYFLKGLRGEADANKDKVITTGEMIAYLEAEVPFMAGRLNKEQTPMLSGRKDVVLVRLK